MSEREFRALEEWVPTETLRTRASGYQRAQAQTQARNQSQGHGRGQGRGQGTFNSANAHGNASISANNSSNANANFDYNHVPAGPRRGTQTTNKRRGRGRGRNRTSSIFEEWKAQALVDDRHKRDGKDCQKVASNNEKSSTGAGVTISNVGGTVAAATTPGPSITEPTCTSVSTAGRSVGQPATSQITSTPVGSSAAGTKGRSYRARPRNNSLVRQESGATEGGQKKIVNEIITIAAPAGPSAGFSNTRSADSVTGFSGFQHVGPVADAKGTKGQPKSDGEVAHVRQGSKSIEVGKNVSSATQGATVAMGPSAPSDTRPGVLAAVSSEAKHAASTADTDSEVTKGSFRPEDPNSCQGSEGQKDASVSTTPTSESRLIGSAAGPCESQHTATEGGLSKVAIEDSTVSPSAGSSGAADMTDSAGHDTTTDKSELKKGLSKSGKDGKNSHVRHGSGPSSIKVETSKASKDSGAAPADPSGDSSNAPASSTGNDKFAAISGSRSRRGGKRGSHRRAKSGSAPTEGGLKNVESSSAAPVEYTPADSIANEATEHSVTASSFQPQTGKGRKSRHGRQKSASVTTGEVVKAVDNKDNKEPSTKRSSAPVALTVDQDKTAINSRAPKVDAKSSQARGVSVFNSARESKVEKDSFVKLKEFIKPSSEQAASGARTSGSQAKPTDSHMRSAMVEESVRTRQASVSAFVEEWKESTSVCEESLVKTSGAPVPSTTDSPGGQHAITSSHSQLETSEEDFHDCQVSVDSTEESNIAVSSNAVTATSEESPIKFSGVPIASIADPSEIQSAAASSNLQPETATEDSRAYQKAEHTPTESQLKKSESNNGDTTEIPASHSRAFVGSSAGQPEKKPAIAAGSDEAKDDKLQRTKGKDTQRSSESTSASESKAPVRQNAAQQLIPFCPAQVPENKPIQSISKGPKADPDRRVSTTINKKSDRRAVSRQHEQEGYTAPNGTFLNKNQLARLVDGIKNANGDTAYFQPSFIEDPWAGMKPVKIPCSRR